VGGLLGGMRGVQEGECGPPEARFFSSTIYSAPQLFGCLFLLLYFQPEEIYELPPESRIIAPLSIMVTDPVLTDDDPPGGPPPPHLRLPVDSKHYHWEEEFPGELFSRSYVA